MLSSGLIHIINVVVSILLGSLSGGDECGLYYTAVVFDVTLGTSICFGLMYAFDRAISYKQSKRLKSGNYFKKLEGEEGSKKYAIDYCCWFQQTLIWCLIVLVMKIVVTGLQFIFRSWISAWGNFSMRL